MLQRCALAASPAVALCSTPRGGVAPAALLSKHRSRSAVCSAKRPLLVGFAARRHARNARLRNVPPSSRQRGPTCCLPPWLASLADAAARLQRDLAAGSTNNASGEVDEDDRLTLVAEQEPRVTAVVPRGALASYCRLLRSQTLDWRDTTIVVPHVDGKQLLALAAWLNREPLRYDVVAPACVAAEALAIPLLLRDVDLWLEAQEAKENTKAGGGVLGAFNKDFHTVYNSAALAVESYGQQEARYTRLGASNFDWAMQLARAHNLPRFKAALMATLERLSQRNAMELLLHIARRELLKNTK